MLLTLMRVESWGVAEIYGIGDLAQRHGNYFLHSTVSALPVRQLAPQLPALWLWSFYSLTRRFAMLKPKYECYQCCRHFYHPCYAWLDGHTFCTHRCLDEYSATEEYRQRYKVP